jgi:hypothetical protein
MSAQECVLGADLYRALERTMAPVSAGAMFLSGESL